MAVWWVFNLCPLCVLLCSWIGFGRIKTGKLKNLFLIFFLLLLFLVLGATIAMPRCRMDKEEGEKHLGLLKLMQILSFLVVFVAGVVIGLATTSHVSRYFTSQTELYSFINHFSVPTTHVEENCTDSNICERRDCSSFHTFIHPDNLTHAMSDDELFWRASMVSKRENDYPFERVPKVAFMFLTRGPLPMLPLWERFFAGHEKLFSIYVHALPGYKLNVSTSSVFYRRQIPSQVFLFLSSICLVLISYHSTFSLPCAC